MDTMSLYESVQGQMLSAYDFLKDEYERGLMEYVLYPDQVHEVAIPIVMDDGQTRTFAGYRSQHNRIRGPYKGGIRFHQDVSKDEVMSLSAWMSLKCSVVGIPLGGGKGGVIVNPKELSVGELERLSRGFMRGIAPYIGPEIDVPAPDVNTTPQIMAWMLDEYEKVSGRLAPGVITGKPLSIGGSAGRGAATATGGFYVLQRYLEKQGETLSGKRIAIQGAGNAGLIFADLADAAGAKVVAISDSRGAIHLEGGIDVSKVESLKGGRQSVTEYDGAMVISNDALLELDVDILVPAALENQITQDNADRVQAGVILELANGPTTADADAVLFAKGVVVIPDVLANAGGVTVSYFEQVQNNMNFYRDAQEVDIKLKKIMLTATDDVMSMAEVKSSSLRMAAYVVSLRRMLEALKMRRGR